MMYLDMHFAERARFDAYRQWEGSRGYNHHTVRSPAFADRKKKNGKRQKQQKLETRSSSDVESLEGTKVLCSRQISLMCEGEQTNIRTQVPSGQSKRSRRVSLSLLRKRNHDREVYNKNGTKRTSKH